MANVTYRTDLAGVDWDEMKATLATDNFDNGRAPEQLRASFAHSHSAVIAYIDGRIVGTVRALSDGVCNAYVVDLWTLSAYRRQGIATQMMTRLLAGFEGQHIYLFTDDAVGFYEKLGFQAQGVGMGKVVGAWLHGARARTLTP